MHNITRYHTPYQNETTISKLNFITFLSLSCCCYFVGSYGVLSHGDGDHHGNNNDDNSTSHAEKGGRGSRQGSRPGSGVNRSRRGSSTQSSPIEGRSRKHSGNHDTLR